MITERLSDMVIDEQELKELNDFTNSIGYPVERLEVLIAEIKNELMARGGAHLSEYEQELLKLSRVYFDSFNMSKLKESISQLYPKFKSQSEVRWYYFLSTAIVDLDEYEILKDQINLMKLNFTSKLFSSILNSDFNEASGALSKINVSFSNHVFPKLIHLISNFKSFYFTHTQKMNL